MKTALPLLLLLTLSTATFGQPAGKGITVIDSPSDDGYDRKWALIVGINYEGAQRVQKLDNAENDAAEMAKLLKEHYGFKCDVLLGNKGENAATGQAIRSKLSDFESKVGEKDCFLFYFAGHGTPRDNQPLVYPADVEVNGKVVMDLSAASLIRKEIKARHSLYIFDSCYSGQIAKLSKVAPLDEMRQFEVDEPLDFHSRAIQIMTSTTSNQAARDGKNGHSPFFISLKRGLLNSMTAVELYQHIKGEMSDENAPSEQKPQLVTLAPDVAPGVEVTCGDFLFTGRVPPPSTNSLIFQTLPGSYRTFPGSEVVTTWVEETPWMIPAVRLQLDASFSGDVRSFPSESADHKSIPLDAPRIVAMTKYGRQIMEQPGSYEPTIEKTFGILKNESPNRDRGRMIADALSAIKSRSPEMTGTDWHTIAMLKLAQYALQSKKPDNDQLLEVHKMFDDAATEYERDGIVGLKARCLADHANWLFQAFPDELRDEANGTGRYSLATGYLTDALRLVGESPGTELFQIELHAGAAWAYRRKAKELVTEIVAEEDQGLNNRKLARNDWAQSLHHYREALRIAEKDRDAYGGPLVAYLNLRMGWLQMDLWNVEEATRYFVVSTEQLDSNETELSEFLNYASGAQGLAMARRLSGECPKGELIQIQGELIARSEQMDSGSPEWCLLQARLTNTTERLAECDFLNGRLGLASAMGPLSDGRSLCAAWEDKVFAGSDDADKCRAQELRFLTKMIIAATLNDELANRNTYKARVEAILKTPGKQDKYVELLCELADAFFDYGNVKLDNSKIYVTQNAKISAMQAALDKIRSVVQLNSTASVDREPAEMLLMISSALIDEQRRLDAKTQRKLLPQNADGKVPADMPLPIRAKYDGVILLQGHTYQGKVADAEFDEFLGLVHDVRQSGWSPLHNTKPFVLFYFPVSGAEGLLILSDVDSYQKRRGEVYSLSFGWKTIPEELDALTLGRVKRVLGDGSVSKGWSDDPLLVKLGFPVEFPFQLSETVDAN